MFLSFRRLLNAFSKEDHFLISLQFKTPTKGWCDEEQPIKAAPRTTECGIGSACFPAPVRTEHT